MSKRFATTCFIVLACILIACVIFVTGLFLLPGVRIFGLKYIGSGTHAHNNLANTADIFAGVNPVDMSVPITEQKYIENGEQKSVGGSYSGITINCYELPVHVHFYDFHSNVYIKYKDNFNGLTNSKIKDPSLSYERTEDGQIVVNISEYHSFIYESSLSDRSLDLYIPFQMVNEGTLYTFNLQINSTKSNVFFEADKDVASNAPATFNRLGVKTNGEIYFNYNVKAKTYSYETLKTIIVNENENIDATNYVLTSHDGKIVINKDVAGDLTCTTTLGKVLLKSCNNLTATTTFGDVGYSGEEGGVIVNGLANISTRAGNVTIDKINGSSEDKKNIISTSSGNVFVGTLLDGEITTQRGGITINQVRDASVVSKTGKVVIQEVTSKLYAKTIRSSITLGGESMLVNDIDIHSNLGNVKVLSASGKVNIDTYDGNVDFYNLDSNDITISCAKLTADRLKGKVTITARKNIAKAAFYDLSQGDVNIITEKKCKNVNLYINEEYQNSVNYYVYASSVNVKQYLKSEWQDLSGKDSSSDTYEFTGTGNAHSFNLKRANNEYTTNVVIYFSTTANFPA